MCDTFVVNGGGFWQEDGAWGLYTVLFRDNDWGIIFNVGEVSVKGLIWWAYKDAFVL